jgi:hypothetical protein
VHCPVPEVLPGVEDAGADPELEAGDQDPVDGFGEQQLPRRKRRDSGAGDVVEGRREERVVPASEGAGQQRVGRSHVLGDGGGVETERPEDGWERALRQADASCPDGDVIVLHACHLPGLGQGQDGDGHNLDYLLENDIPRHLPPRRQVALGDLVGRVQPVLREQVVDIDNVEEHGYDPVGDVRRENAQPKVGDEGQEIGYRPGLVRRQRW